MKTRQAKKIHAVAANPNGIRRYNPYWVKRWIEFLWRFRLILRDSCGDHRIRKAIAICEKGKRKHLKR